MHHKTHYATVSEAINKLRSEGFTTDFNLEKNCITCNSRKIDPEDLRIVDVYRYEGITDPSDEATVYALKSKSTDLKGILVTTYGIYQDAETTKTLEKLKFAD